MKFPLELAIGNKWVPVKESADITFPYDGSVIAKTPVGNARLAKEAVEQAVSIRAEMAAMPSHARRKALMDTYDDIAARADEIEQILVLETGKPLVDCKVEVARTLLTLQTAAEEISKLHGETVPLDVSPAGEGMFGFWVRKPIGVVVAITGFNYPLLLAVHKLAPAIAAGCPVIIKPPPQAPITTIMLVTLLRDALSGVGGPEGGVQLVTGGPDVGEALTTDPRIGCVSFTGSAEVGHQIARAAAPTKVVLELGSNAALIVAADADLDAAADAVIRGGYYANGQACISVQRVIVVESVKDAFMAKLLPALDRVAVGDPRLPETRVAALIDSGSTGRVRSWVYSAVSAGATLAAGGGISGTALEPTVLLDVPDGADAWDEEIFGPVVAVRGVPDLDAAYDTLNNSRYGLHCSIFTSSLATAYDAVDRIEAGGIVINEVPGFRSDIAPYGGVKDSGIGREGPRFAMEEMTVTRMVAIRPSPSREA
ncbi:acyl-CoA reductase-like NAD-dependent aldehyde dehydrogenase [Antricoccus suffuscus]|uniref:Acyl-CoA reductase-like NAD-dependent aldehyde dehydrogenase n=1 Tax=Antricoccus suffuscus TaxID=1629062 RepID=A0A2T1A6K2_9ACTN|nr:aldehyde dehydrogenase family protein [Antricoccus suffuscus]PRZ44184.1 acyl-CoA reductase-like NAD-dependent aldehyde dehydrogenase [Antricoccus suffuscus]